MDGLSHPLSFNFLWKDLDLPSLSRIGNAMAQISFQDGHQIFRKGDKGDLFYVIQEGKVELSDLGLLNKTKTLISCDYFGERALVGNGGKRTANATAVGDCILLYISKETIETIIGSLEDMIDHLSQKRILMSVSVFKRANLDSNGEFVFFRSHSQKMNLCLISYHEILLLILIYFLDLLSPHKELDRLSNVMTRGITFNEGSCLIEEGKPITNIPHGIILIRGGEITISRPDGAATHLRRDDYFGDEFLYNDEIFFPSFTATVRNLSACFLPLVD